MKFSHVTQRHIARKHRRRQKSSRATNSSLWAAYIGGGEPEAGYGFAILKRAVAAPTMHSINCITRQMKKELTDPVFVGLCAIWL